MRILLLMPLNEGSEHVSLSLMQNLQRSGIDTLAVPAFMNYLTVTGLADGFEQSVLKGIISVKDFVSSHPNCIVIGNATKDIHFDEILAVNSNLDAGVEQEDLQLLKMREKYNGEPDVLELLDTYSAKERYSLGGSVEAIGDFIRDIWNTTMNN